MKREEAAQEVSALRSQIATSNAGRRRYLPLAITEQGEAMVSSVLRSKRAVQVNVEIMRAFVKLRGLLATHQNLARKLEELGASTMHSSRRSSMPLEDGETVLNAFPDRSYKEPTS
jgi:hypothetical protein